MRMGQSRQQRLSCSCWMPFQGCSQMGLSWHWLRSTSRNLKTTLGVRNIKFSWESQEHESGHEAYRGFRRTWEFRRSLLPFAISARRTWEIRKESPNWAKDKGVLRTLLAIAFFLQQRDGDIIIFIADLSMALGTGICLELWDKEAGLARFIWKVLLSYHWDTEWNMRRSKITKTQSRWMVNAKCLGRAAFTSHRLATVRRGDALTWNWRKCLPWW